MATDGTNLTALADVLKNVYGDAITEQFNNETTLYNLLPKSGRKPTGNGYFFGVQKANPQGIGARNDGEILPDPFPGKYDQGKIVPKYHYGVLRTSGPAIEASKGNMSAFIEALGGEINSIYNGMVVDLNRMSWGDGFGKLATLSAASTAKTSASWTATCDNDAGTRYVQEGMVVDFYPTGGAIDQDVTSSRVSRVDHATKKVYFEALTKNTTYQANHPIVAARSYTVLTTGSTTIPASSVMVRQGARDVAFATSDTPVEIMGMDALFDDGTALSSFENITVSGNEYWKANILSNSSVNRELTLELMLRALDITRTRTGMRVSKMVMGLGQRRKYAELLLPDVRFQPATLKGGYETLTFSGGDGSVEIIIDPVAQPNSIYCMPDGAIQVYEMTPLGWGNLDGSQMHRRQGYDQWDQFLRLYTQIGTEQRNCLTKLTDLTEPSLY